MACVALLVCGQASAQTLRDNFTNRLTVTSLSGQVSQSNSNATVEPGEPLHGGKPGGHSLWISWIAPTNGIVRFKTETSGFDTLLSAYQFTTTNGTTFADLREVARADDSEGLEHESDIQFGVWTGQCYEIAVDGYRGAVGRVEFDWEFEVLTNPPPLILNTLADRAANTGETVRLTFNLTNIANAELKWFFNGAELDAESTHLTLTNFQSTNTGSYKLRVAVNGGQFFSVPVEVQINTEDATNILASSKVLDSRVSPLIGNVVIPPQAQARTTVRGYNGSQIFNTTLATVDTNEPVHCGVVGGKSYWLNYQPPTNGTITLDTLGSSYDTVMECYTYNGTPMNYASLIPLACADNSFGSNNAAQLVIPVVSTRQYLVVVAGVNGAAGTASLNYSLNTNQLPQPPAINGATPPQTLAVGSSMSLTAPVTGAGPLMFAWFKNGVPMPGENSSVLFLPNVGAAASGNYTFTVTNDLGSVSGSFVVKVVTPITCTLMSGGNALQLGFPTTSGEFYTVEETTDLLSAWTAWPGALVGNGLTNYFNVPLGGGKFYRVRIE